MYASYAAKASAGSKPVAHQAPVVLSARLRRRGMGQAATPPIKGNDECTADVNELAFVAAREHNQYPEPEYFTAVNTVPDQYRLDAGDRTKFSNSTDLDKDDITKDDSPTKKLTDCWKAYSFLGVIQTPGNNKGLSPHDYGALGGSTNVVHAGGTMTTMNHGLDHIQCNDTVAWFFPTVNIPDGLPKCWTTSAGSASRVRAGVFKVEPGTDAYELARKYGAILGRAIAAASPGAQLDLILTV